MQDEWMRSPKVTWKPMKARWQLPQDHQSLMTLIIMFTTVIIVAVLYSGYSLCFHDVYFSCRYCHYYLYDCYC